MKKKVLALLMVACMLIGLLAGCGNGSSSGGNSAATFTDDYDTVEINGYQYKKYKDITDEEITLTYFHFDQDETVQYLAERFMEIYPNIHVEVKYENVATYNDTLNTLVANQNTPDITCIPTVTMHCPMHCWRMCPPTGQEIPRLPLWHPRSTAPVWVPSIPVPALVFPLSSSPVLSTLI